MRHSGGRVGRSQRSHIQYLGSVLYPPLSLAARAEADATLTVVVQCHQDLGLSSQSLYQRSLTLRERGESAERHRSGPLAQTGRSLAHQNGFVG